MAMQGLQLSVSSVWRAVRKAGLKAFRQRVKPKVTDAQKAMRRRFAIDEKNTNWNDVFFADEKSFLLISPPNRKNDIIWEEHAANVPDYPKVKHPPKIHIWGAISYQGIVQCEIFTENLTAPLYKDILRRRLIPTANRLYPRRQWLYLQDRDPKHQANQVQFWLPLQCARLITMPPNSPDLNPIENIWSILTEKVRQHSLNNVEQLKRAVFAEWHALSMVTIRKTINSMPKRLAAVRSLRGGMTKY
jgi:hypothetical protein